MAQAESAPDDKPSAATTKPSFSSYQDYLNSEPTSRGVWDPYSTANKKPTSSGASAGQHGLNDRNGNGTLTPSTSASLSASAQSSSTSSTAFSFQKAKGVALPSFALPLGVGEQSSSASIRSLGSLITGNFVAGHAHTRPPPIKSDRRVDPASNHLFQALAQAQTDGTTQRPAGNSNWIGHSDAGAISVHNPGAIKMKRTGQNFPLNSAIASSHQRKGSDSPIRRPATLPGVLLRKHLGLDSNRASAAPSATRETPVPVPKFPPFGTQGPKPSTAVGSEKPGAPSQARLPNGGNGAKSSFTIPDSDPDDIMYEPAGHAADLAEVGLPADDAIEENSSSDSSDSQSEGDDDDETIEIDDDNEVALRQLFQAPTQEIDEDETEEDETDDDDSSSESSSSGDSSIANVPAPALDLPSANIQHQVDYPSKILSRAEPGRSYGEIYDNGKTIKASPAMFPIGYSKSNYVMCPWVCAVRSCSLCYATPAGLSNHARFTHKKGMFNDNMDGTVSLVGSYSQKSPSGHYPPVVVSRRPLDPKEPPMREPSIPAYKITNGMLRQADVGAQQSNLNYIPNHGLDEEDVVMDDSEEGILEPLARPARPQTADRESSEQMWKYVRPFLSVHKSIPETNWAQHILQLPRVRDIVWNEERMKEHAYRDSHARDVTALLVQITGIRSPKPCERCSLGRGPFIGCIMISPEASDGAKAAVLSCANCYYHCGQSTCSHCKADIGRRMRQARVRGHKTKHYNLKQLSDEAQGKSDRTTARKLQNLYGPGPGASPVDASIRRAFKLYHPSEFTAIEKATSERTYKVIKAKDGSDQLMCGALIPEQYDLDHTVAGYPWICSIRSCRKVFKKIVSLGSHFIRAHTGCLLNDNLDGTLSQVGYYDIARPGVSGLPATIISRNPLDPNEPPMENPARPGPGKETTVVRVPRAKRNVAVIKYADASGSFLQEHVNPADVVTTDLWDYMLPYLPDNVASAASSPRILGLLDLPRQRNIQWRQANNHKLSDHPREIAGLIIYLTGEELGKGCTCCARGNGPFPRCIGLKKGVPFESRPAVRSCANCIFSRKSNECSLKGWKWQPAPAEARALPIADFAPDGRLSEPGISVFKRPRITDSETEEPLAIRRRADRSDLALREDGVTRAELIRNARSAPGSGSMLHPGMLETASCSNGGGLMDEPTPPQSRSALILEGQVQPDEVLEMEPWEIAPGRIRATGATGPNLLACSKSFLETNKAVRVSRDVLFEVKTIKSGHTLDLEVDRTRARYCSIAVGKLHFTVTEQSIGEETLIVGTHGLVTIWPGMSARIQNRLYVDSLVHISTVDG